MVRSDVQINEEIGRGGGCCKQGGFQRRGSRSPTTSPVHPQSETGGQTSQRNAGDDANMPP